MDVPNFILLSLFNKHMSHPTLNRWVKPNASSCRTKHWWDVSFTKIKMVPKKFSTLHLIPTSWFMLTQKKVPLTSVGLGFPQIFVLYYVLALNNKNYFRSRQTRTGLHPYYPIFSVYLEANCTVFNSAYTQINWQRLQLNTSVLSTVTHRQSPKSSV